jgi:hypothetical protein
LSRDGGWGFGDQQLADEPISPGQCRGVLGERIRDIVDWSGWHAQESQCVQSPVAIECSFWTGRASCLYLDDEGYVASVKLELLLEPGIWFQPLAIDFLAAPRQPNCKQIGIRSMNVFPIDGASVENEVLDGTEALQSQVPVHETFAIVCHVVTPR